MIEYQSTEGGRHLYNADIKNLQELALAMVQLFKDCEANFVISGCRPYGRINNLIVPEGYVYLDGRICKVAGATGMSRDNLYIVAKQENGDSIPYADGTYHYQNINYYAEVVNTTSPEGTYIKYDINNGFPDLSSVFFNKYAVTKNEGSQVIDSLVVNNLTTKNKLSADKGVVFNSDSDFYITSTDDGIKIGSGNNSYYFVLTADGKICAYDENDDVLFTLSGTDGVEINGNNIAKIKSDLQNDLVPVGTILMWPNVDNIPANYLLCDGRQLSSADYPELFSVLRSSTRISQPFRASITASNIWTFSVPNLKGRFVVGYSGDDESSTDSTNYNTLGNKGGEDSHTLTIAELPSHSHSYDKTESISNGGTAIEDSSQITTRAARVAAANTTANSASSGTVSGGGVSDQTEFEVTYTSKETETTGGGQPHENRPAYYVLAYIIKAK